MLNVTAFDQAGNKQAAIWSINDIDENKMSTEKEVSMTAIHKVNSCTTHFCLPLQREGFLVLPIGGGSKTYQVEDLGADFANNCYSGLKHRLLEFSLVQVTTGGVVSCFTYLCRPCKLENMQCLIE